MLRAAVFVVALVCVTLTGFTGGPVHTDAAWTDSEFTTSDTMTAGKVTAVSNLNCSEGLLGAIDFTWTAPASGGLARSGYRWALVGAVDKAGTLGASAISMSLPRSLLDLGSGIYSLYAVGPGGWESAAATASVTFLTGLVSNCSPLVRSP
ncbi:hypothetical protein ASD56_06265 [Microbacterium sp. Root166]|nr:hypothetical protein ASD56_06265 [Microbacterium sp. Root166]